ncbi:hypothetical protein Ndes2526B_g07531 [Nannochloris sp. 'desiccata']|nr:putative Plastid-lipid-associated protein 6, chloroplastic [Chlorella desiccata (nom. nud.)]
MASDSPTPDDESSEDSSLPPEDLDVVVDFYTRSLSEKKAAEEEATAPIAGGRGGGGNGNGTDTPAEQPPPALPPPAEEPEALKLEAPSASALLPSDAESVHEDSNKEHHRHHKKHRITELQEQLLALLSTLDRGLAASGDDVTKVENFVLQLENAGEPVVLDIPTSDSSTNKRKSCLKLLDGRWRLAYSSGFSGGNLGGRRPGPPASLAPVTLGAVYQDIFVAAKELDNVVTLTAKVSLASLFQIEPPAVTARLKHSFRVEGAATVRIVFENTIAKTSGGIGGWLDSLPQFATPMLPEFLRPVIAPAGDATFDVTFLDEKMRITRGDRGELRVFVKESLRVVVSRRSKDPL